MPAKPTNDFRLKCFCAISTVAGVILGTAGGYSTDSPEKNMIIGGAIGFLAPTVLSGLLLFIRETHSEKPQTMTTAPRAVTGCGSIQ